MAFIEVTVGGNKQLLNVDAIEQVLPGPNGQSTIYLSGGEQRTMIQAQQSVEQIGRALLTAGRQTVVAGAH